VLDLQTSYLRALAWLIFHHQQFVRKYLRDHPTRARFETDLVQLQPNFS